MERIEPFARRAVRIGHRQALAALLAWSAGIVSAADAATAEVATATTAASAVATSTGSGTTTAPAYQRSAPTADGIGKRYLGREISRVMGWQGAAWLEREEREREENTGLLLRELQLRPGTTVADIGAGTGAGTGYVARRIAALVGPGGQVDAVDVQPEMVAMLRTLATREGLAQIRPVQGAVDDVRLPSASVDLAIMVDVYHELEFPRELLASLVRAMKPGGRVVFVEYRAEDPAVPIKPLHKMSEAQVRREAEAGGLVWERTIGSLPWQHAVVFQRP